MDPIQCDCSDDADSPCPLDVELDRLRAENEYLRNDVQVLETQRDHLLGEHL